MPKVQITISMVIWRFTGTYQTNCPFPLHYHIVEVKSNKVQTSVSIIYKTIYIRNYIAKSEGEEKGNYGGEYVYTSEMYCMCTMVTLFPIQRIHKTTTSTFFNGWMFGVTFRYFCVLLKCSWNGNFAENMLNLSTCQSVCLNQKWCIPPVLVRSRYQTDSESVPQYHAYDIIWRKLTCYDLHLYNYMVQLQLLFITFVTNINIIFCKSSLTQPHFQKQWTKK